MSLNLKLNKYFIEPNNKYICFTTCLFNKKKYIRNILNKNKYIQKNMSSNKENNFIENLIKINESLLNGYYPDNFYLRLYYDKNILKIKKYKELLNILKKNKKVQLIEYDINDIYDPLIGTLIRFYTFFDQESKNLEYSICIDSDQFYNKKCIEVFKNFVKTKKLVYSISRLYYIPEHTNDYQESNDFFNFITLIANFIIVKKNKIFKIEYWEKYFNNIFKQNDLMYILNYNSFKKYTLNSIVNKDIKEYVPYTSFNYGIDELWINFVLKKILEINNAKNMLDIYLCDFTNLFKNKNYKNKNISLLSIDSGKFYKFLIRLKLCFKYNNLVNYKIFKYFIKECTFLKIKSYNQLIKYIDYIEYNFKNYNKESLKILLSFYKIIKKNKYLDMIYIDNNIKYIIYNYNYIYKKIDKYSYGEFLY